MSRSKQLPYVLLALGSAAYLYLFMRVLWRVGDEGTLVYGAERVAEGAVPYRDFVEVMGPGSFYWLGLFFKLFGESWFVTRALLLLTGVAMSLITYWLARRLNSRWSIMPAVSLLVITLPLWPATNHHWDSNLFAVLSFAAFLLWVQSSLSLALLAAGLLAGITTMFMLPKGVLLLASYLLIVWMLRQEEPGWLSAAVKVGSSYMSVVTTVVVYFYSTGALRAFIYANIIWPCTSYHKVNSVPYGYGLHELFWNFWVGLLAPATSVATAYSVTSVFLLPLLVIAALPLLALILAAGQWPDAFHRATLPYWIAGLALWLSEIHRKDMMHLIYGSPILLVLCTYLWQRRPERFWRYGARALVFSIVLFAGSNALVARAAQAKIVTRRGTVYAFSQDAALEFLDKKVQAGQEVFVYPYYPMYYFLSGTENPTRYSILMYHNNTDAQFREAVAALEQKKVRYVLWDTVVDGANLKQWFPSYEQPPKEKLIVEPYLMQHYDLVAIKSGFRLMQRKDEASAGNRITPEAAPGS